MACVVCCEHGHDGCAERYAKELLAERDELRELVVWAVNKQAHIELSNLQSGLDLVGDFAFRWPCDGTPASLIEALRRAKEGRGDGV